MIKISLPYSRRTRYKDVGVGSFFLVEGELYFEHDDYLFQITEEGIYNSDETPGDNDLVQPVNVEIIVSYK
jgi:hypothetical protein